MARTVTLRDGARATLRPIAPEDKPLLAASFERLGEESRYRRFFTVKKELSPAELDYLVDVNNIELLQSRQGPIPTSWSAGT